MARPSRLRAHRRLLSLTLWMMIPGGLIALTLFAMSRAINVAAWETSRRLLSTPAEVSLSMLVPTSSPTESPAPSPSPNPSPTPTGTPTPEPSPIVPPTPTPYPFFQEPLPPTDGQTRTLQVPILMYHYISDPPSGADRFRLDLSVRPSMFEAHLQYLRQAGYETVSLSDLIFHLTQGHPLPPRPIVLTFDDGYRDAYEEAFPRLQRYGFRGTFFVLTGRADEGDPRYLSWEQIRQMSEAGMDIQLHGREHVPLSGRDEAFLFYHIIGGKQSIEAHTGRPVRFLAYPSSDYDQRLIQFLEGYRFWGAVTTAFGADERLENRFLWPRIRIRGTDDVGALMWKLSVPK
ncbi:polysaccharide deacetylase family protein [Thermoflexus sp.]|uniref:polysaccharide deacetylase family protein n=1 Tax=Thermoflexus sp. TaxID=1969742 RepID=UPI0025F841C0|nr:polysaccharide deacetylase family protein [Thermoflexus sp.]MDW8064079.1 polysaccharide deacetylase family protein [Anaerolineae bacterium]MCS6962591.1 polysaccharide deacetylase family protein [Thermoflexus sp.]MCS7351858.1 polysaccharide deacetylase family protein [Thermoflexus sp.]MCX7690197.1 polysaccharide deacetylase family protein [Thermoflexus sp.]MDW8181317.1 polysaccharide deacetylase family protein [Anaerolineae bacterium]